jgi:uncharacterized damage-inducible protein DinB
MTRHLHKLYAHVEWANRRVLEALQASPGKDPEALTYFAHVLGAEDVWLSRIEGVAPKVAVWPTLSLEKCRELALSNVARFREHLSSLSDADFDRPISYVNSAGAAFTSTLDDILIHVAVHGAYHRGQISLMMRRGGGIPAATDFIAFVRGAPAATQADSLPVPSRATSSN